ncbi:hypothetical protein ABZZ20_30560 [Streptomyces sp. NPDC006430]|uniref:hypothetical protein n=1 Tax=Streptomyces sp. NPDC006430 TaxID=3154299 RepID=UPI00339E8E6C
MSSLMVVLTCGGSGHRQPVVAVASSYAARVRYGVEPPTSKRAAMVMTGPGLLPGADLLDVDAHALSFLEGADLYGMHADARTLYPAMTPARQESHLHLPLDELEDPHPAGLGPVRSDTERLAGAVAAYGRRLEGDGDDVMVTEQLTRLPAQPAHAPWRQRRYGHLPAQRAER